MFSALVISPLSHAIMQRLKQWLFGPYEKMLSDYPNMKQDMPFEYVLSTSFLDLD